MTEPPRQPDEVCPASGRDVGRMVAIPGSDDWKIHCPECGTWWHGGSTVLDEHRGGERGARRRGVVVAGGAVGLISRVLM